MPHARSNIETQQNNVTWTRLGFNVSKTKHIHDIGESSTTTMVLVELQFSRPDANFESHRRQHVAKKHSLSRLPKLKIQTCTACGTHNVMLIEEKIVFSKKYFLEMNKNIQPTCVDGTNGSFVGCVVKIYFTNEDK